MDDYSVEGFTSSSPLKFGENKENDEIGSPKSQKSKKGAMKHFMSPTISAATKAALFPRNKILAERNEPFTFTNSEKPQILKSRTFDCDSSLNEPYDPLIDYLSPRPTFLRYNPNRKRRIFLHRENGIKERKDGLGVVSISSSFEARKEVVEEKVFEECSVKNEEKDLERTEDDRIDCDDEDLVEVEDSEEFEEKMCWSLLGLLKFLLVLGSLHLSASFIYSMNSPGPLLIQEAVWEFKGGFVNQSYVHEEIYRMNKYFVTEFLVMDGQGEKSRISLVDMVTDTDVEDNVFVEAWISQKNGTRDGLLESTAGEHEVIVNQSSIHEGVTRNEYFISESEAMDGKGEESRISLMDVVTQKDMDDNEFVEAEISQDERNGALILESTAEFPEVNEVAVEKSKDVCKNDLMSKVKVCDTLHWAEPNGSEANTDIEVVDHKAEAFDIRADESVRDEEVKRTSVGFDQVQGTETAEVVLSFQEAISSAIEPSTDLNDKDEMMGSEEIEIQIEVIVLAVSLCIVAALGFLDHSWQRNTCKKKSSPAKENNGKKEILPIETQQTNVGYVEAAHQKQNYEVVFNVDEEKVKKVKSVANPSIKVVTEEFSRQSQSPVVELLGELVIGAEPRSSYKRCEMRRAPLDPKKKNLQSKASLVKNQGYSPPLELSTAVDYPSQKKRFAKKEESKGGKASNANVTPVRRSSRIRNKALSP